MKDSKHIKSFNEHQENSNTSNVKGMSVKQLIEHLSKFDENVEVMLLDGFNGQGNKRTINFTPSNLKTITQEEDDDLGDCEGKAGSQVVVLGYGFY